MAWISLSPPNVNQLNMQSRPGAHSVNPDSD